MRSGGARTSLFVIRQLTFPLLRFHYQIFFFSFHVGKNYAHRPVVWEWIAKIGDIRRVYCIPQSNYLLEFVYKSYRFLTFLENLYNEFLLCWHLSSKFSQIRPPLPTSNPHHVLFYLFIFIFNHEVQFVLHIYTWMYNLPREHAPPGMSQTLNENPL